MSSEKNKSGIVYSTNPDHKYSAKPHQGASIAPGQQDLRVIVDKKNRGGKTVTIVKGFIGKESDFEKLGKELKSKCGVGGTVKDEEIIIQGEHKERVVAILVKMGFKAK